ncbi:hypothetical protein Ancab_031302 [Ancistrocladus abbreviatus]
MEWEEGQLSIAQAVDKDIILSQTVSEYDQNPLHLSGNQDDSKVKPTGDILRATCSSTLKESKFPPYLMLNLRGSESEETSIMKVCPYTYSSLNSHRHSSAPLLKSFLNSRREFIAGKETQIASTRNQIEEKRVDDTKLLTFMRSSVSMMELVDVEDNEAEDDADRSLEILSASQQADDKNNLTEVQHHSPNVEHLEKPIVEELVDFEEQSGKQCSSDTHQQFYAPRTGSFEEKQLDTLMFLLKRCSKPKRESQAIYTLVLQQTTLKAEACKRLALVHITVTLSALSNSKMNDSKVKLIN